MDYRELNNFVDTYTANADICAQKLQEWRQQGSNVATLDLRITYLQVQVYQLLCPFQTIMIKGQRYCLTQLGFSLNVAPKIMSAIMNVVMSQDVEIQRATSSYIDNVYINENVASSRRVKEHLECFDLVCKAPEPLQDGVNVLGLHVSGDGEKLCWRRGSDIPEVPPVITCWSTFSMSGETSRPFSHMQLLHQDGMTRCTTLLWDA